MTDASTENPVHFVFVGAMDQDGAHRIGQAINAALSDNKTHIHLMVQSLGGQSGDGVFIYNILRTIPVHVTTYNCGHAMSAGATAFLGGAVRVASPSALFMVHKTHYSPQFATSATLNRLADAALSDDQRLEMILGQHIKFTPEQQAGHATGDLWLNADSALECGLATAIGEFTIPPGTRPYFI